MQTLTVELDDEVYGFLKTSGRELQKSPEALAGDWLAAAIRHATDDPLEGVIGSLPGNVPGWTNRHDELIGEALASEIRGAGSGHE